MTIEFLCSVLLNSQLRALIPHSQLPTLKSQSPTLNPQLLTPKSQFSVLTFQLGTQFSAPSSHPPFSILNSQLATHSSRLPNTSSQFPNPNCHFVTLDSQLPAFKYQLQLLSSLFPTPNSQFSLLNYQLPIRNPCCQFSNGVLNFRVRCYAPGFLI